MKHREALDEPVLQLFQSLEEHDVVRRAVPIEQEEAATRLAREYAFHDRQDRRDAGAGRKADMDASHIGRWDHAEAPGRGHHVEFIAAFQLVGRPARERAAIDLLHGDADFAVIRARAD